MKRWRKKLKENRNKKNKNRIFLWKDLAPVVRRLDNALHWINLYPVYSAARFLSTFIRPFNNWGLNIKWVDIDDNMIKN